MNTATRGLASQSTWFTRLAVLGIIIIASVGAYWIGSFTLFRAQGHEPLSVDDASLNFGEVWQDPTFVWQLSVSNTTNGQLTVQEFRRSCTCVSVEPQSFSLSAGEAISLRLTLNLDRRTNPAQVNETIYDFSAVLQPVLRGPLGGDLYHPGWTIQGRVRSPFTFRPASLLFSHRLILGQPLPAESVRVFANVPLKSLTATSDPSVASPTVTPLPGQPDAYELSIKPNGAIPCGHFVTTIGVHGTTQTGERLPPVFLSVEGTVEEEVQAVPTSVILGPLNKGDIGRETILLQSLADQAFKVERVECSSPTVTVKALTSASGPRQEFGLASRVTHAGIDSTTVTFHIRTTGGRTIKLKVPVSCIGA